MHLYKEYIPDWIPAADWQAPTHDEFLLVTYHDELGAPQIMTAYYQADTTFWALNGYYAGLPHAVYHVEYYGKTVPAWWIAVAIPWEPLPYDPAYEPTN
jgi:hypothetical protein